MNINIIGAGSLGSYIALALYSSSRISICNKNLSSSKKAADLIGGIAVSSINLLPAADITFITTPDDTIEDIARTYSENKALRPGSIVAHCSGFHSSSILESCRNRNCFTASIHPFKPFAKDLQHKDSFIGCDCVLEGDDKACEVLKELFSKLGANVIMLQTNMKHTYHAAAVIASNYLVTLAQISNSLLVDTGISPQNAKQMTINLMRANLDNVDKCLAINQALTGPIARGDCDTVKMHISALQDKDVKLLYKIAGLVTLKLTNHNEEKLEKIRSILMEL